MLRQRAEERCHKRLREILADSIFVGCIDREQILIQFESNLYLCNLKSLSEELFYQILLYDFENFATMKFDPPLSVIELAEIALKSKESGWCEGDGPINELATSVRDILIEKAPILREYYGVSITIDGHLDTLPILLDNHLPSLSQLPMYLLRLATEVDWETEKRCFETFSRETAVFYSYIPRTTSDDNEWMWSIEHVIHDNLKRYLMPPKSFAEHILQIANLQNLYKVFERC